MLIAFVKYFNKWGCLGMKSPVEDKVMFLSILTLFWWAYDMDVEGSEGLDPAEPVLNLTIFCRP